MARLSESELLANMAACRRSWDAADTDVENAESALEQAKIGKQRASVEWESLRNLLNAWHGREVTGYIADYPAEGVAARGESLAPMDGASHGA